MLNQRVIAHPVRLAEERVARNDGLRLAWPRSGYHDLRLTFCEIVER